MNTVCPSCGRCGTCGRPAPVVGPYTQPFTPWVNPYPYPQTSPYGVGGNSQPYKGPQYTIWNAL